MSITLDLPPEIENALQEVAQATHQMPVDYAAQIIVAHLSPVVSLLQREGRSERLGTPVVTTEHVSHNRGFGFLKGRISSDDFLAEKHAEAQREREKDEARSFSVRKLDS
ncbi:hypothetical protein EON83_25565 [bacterium]|nr:MAG: hypothetical protein EON83_25565 [bacterium]